MTDRRRALLVMLPLLLAACGDGAAEQGGTTTVDGVTLEVPAGWGVVEQPDAPGVVASHGWSPGTADARHLQVVIGCDGTVDELVDEALQQPRGPLVVTAAEEDRAQQRVEGLDTVRRLDLTFGAGRPDDASTLRTAGLYGQRADALVLVELSQPARDADGELAGSVLDSVRVDAEKVAAACADRG